jgi:hypothetical protein
MLCGEAPARSGEISCFLIGLFSLILYFCFTSCDFNLFSRTWPPSYLVLEGL